MNRSLRSFYDSFHFPEIQKFLDLGKKISLEVTHIFYLFYQIIDIISKSRKINHTNK